MYFLLQSKCNYESLLRKAVTCVYILYFKINFILKGMFLKIGWLELVTGEQINDDEQAESEIRQKEEWQQR